MLGQHAPLMDTYGARKAREERPVVVTAAVRARREEEQRRIDYCLNCQKVKPRCATCTDFYGG